MILQVYTVLDKAVGAFLQPFFCRSKGEALRSFSDACNKEGEMFNKHALDYELVYLGEWDDNGGVFSTAAPVRVISALECRVPDNPFTPETEVRGPVRASNGSKTYTS